MTQCWLFHNLCAEFKFTAFFVFFFLFFHFLVVFFLFPFWNPCLQRIEIVELYTETTMNAKSFTKLATLYFYWIFKCCTHLYVKRKFTGVTCDSVVLFVLRNSPQIACNNGTETLRENEFWQFKAETYFLLVKYPKHIHSVEQYANRPTKRMMNFDLHCLF